MLAGEPGCLALALEQAKDDDLGADPVFVEC